MDAGRFDSIIRSLGGSSTRRSLVGLLAGVTVGVAGAEASARRGHGKRKPGAEGPCGDGSRKDNICSNDSDCCTGICKTGLKNKDGEGRCRCVRKGKECTEDKNCCGGRTCVGGVCGGSTPPPPVCDATSCPEGCCAMGLGVPYAGQNSAGCGTGGAACTPCASSSDACTNGACVASCTLNADSCSGETCCAGNTCNTGYCRTPVGGACNGNDGCFQPLTSGSAMCDVNGLCCYTLSTPCLGDADCCSGLVCTSSQCTLAPT
jgi:hypothetical protein